MCRLLNISRAVALKAWGCVNSICIDLPSVIRSPSRSGSGRSTSLPRKTTGCHGSITYSSVCLRIIACRRETSAESGMSTSHAGNAWPRVACGEKHTKNPPTPSTHSSIRFRVSSNTRLPFNKPQTGLTTNNTNESTLETNYPQCKTCIRIRRLANISCHANAVWQQSFDAHRLLNTRYAPETKCKHRRTTTKASQYESQDQKKGPGVILGPFSKTS